MDTAYALILQCSIPYMQENEEGEQVVVRYDDYAVEFDLVSNVRTDLSSDITNHPLVNGDNIADHMYRNPTTVSVQGAFSLYGNKPFNFPGDSSDRLTNIETFFERIKNEGIHCTLTRFAAGPNSSIRFVQRKNMVLTNISWTEKPAYLEFGLDFAEAMTANVQEAEYDEDITDPNLPALTDAATLDFTDTLLDWQKVDQAVFVIAGETGIASDDFLKSAVEIASGAFVGNVIGAAAGVAVGIGICATIGFSSLSVPVVGWIVAAAAAVGCVIGFIIGAFQNAEKERKRLQYKVETFKKYEDDEKNRQEVERFYNWLGQIHMNLETLEDVLHVYGIASNEPQECMLYMDDSYYIFKFEKNNTNETWSLFVTDEDNRNVAQMSTLVGHADLSECRSNSSSYLFRIPGSGAYVYVMNLKLASLMANKATQDEIDAANKDLTNYAILKADIDMDKFEEMLQKLIDDAMKM